MTVSLAAGTATGDGSDTLSGIENVTGSAQADALTGDGNANVLTGGAGNDVLNGGAGNDTLTGEGGTDTATYAAAAAGVTVSLATGTATGDGSDTLSGIENIIGSASADTLTGDSGANVLSGGAGGDALNGGSGTDTADYSVSTAKVTIDLQNGTAADGDAAGDTLTSIENVIGSDGASSVKDTLYGDANANTLLGLGGNDFLEGGGGADTLDGGVGWDTARYGRSTSGVTVNLATNVNTGGHAEGDLLYNIEAVVGSAHNDTLTGGSGADVLYGEAGNDTLNGNNGDDTLFGRSGLDTLTGGSGADIIVFEAASAFSNIDVITDFSTGQNDKLNLADVLDFDPLTHTITNFVEITTSGTDSILKVDANGMIGGVNFVQIATLQNVTGLTDEQALLNSGNLIAA